MAGKGEPKTGGRKAGTPNKLTHDIIERLEALGCDPIEGMAIIAKQAMADKDFTLAGRMYRELAQYVAPKRKAIEVTAPKDYRTAEQLTNEELMFIASGGN